jgi:hypothetical protein
MRAQVVQPFLPYGIGIATKVKMSATYYRRTADENNSTTRAIMAVAFEVELLLRRMLKCQQDAINFQPNKTVQPVTTIIVIAFNMELTFGRTLKDSGILSTFR